VGVWNDHAERRGLLAGLGRPCGVAPGILARFDAQTLERLSEITQSDLQFALARDLYAGATTRGAESRPNTGDCHSVVVEVYQEVSMDSATSGP
jgi:hypothetical protein